MGWSPLTSPSAVTRSCSRRAPISSSSVSMAPPTRACERNASSARSCDRRPRATRCSSSRSVILRAPFYGLPGSAWTNDEGLGQLVVERLAPPVEEGQPEPGEERHEREERECRAGNGPARCGSEPGAIHQPDAEEAPPGGPPVPEQREGGGVDQPQDQREGDARRQHRVQL